MHLSRVQDLLPVVTFLVPPQIYLTNKIGGSEGVNVHMWFVVMHLGSLGVFSIEKSLNQRKMLQVYKLIDSFRSEQTNYYA